MRKSWTGDGGIVELWSDALVRCASSPGILRDQEMYLGIGQGVNERGGEWVTE